MRSCRPYRSSYAGCQCDRSGSSGLVVGFLRLLRPPKAQNAELSNQSEKHPSGLFAEPNLFTLKQYRLLIIFIDFQQREQTALIVDIGQSRRITDKCAGNPAHSNPRQASQYRLGRNNSCGSKPAAGCLQKQSRFHPPKTSARVSDSPDGRQRSVEIRLLKSIVGRLKGFVFQTAFWFGWGSHQSILAVLDSNY